MPSTVRHRQPDHVTADGAGALSSFALFGELDRLAMYAGTAGSWSYHFNADLPPVTISVPEARRYFRISCEIKRRIQVDVTGPSIHGGSPVYAVSSPGSAYRLEAQMKEPPPRRRRQLIPRSLDAPWRPVPEGALTVSLRRNGGHRVDSLVSGIKRAGKRFDKWKQVK